MDRVFDKANPSRVRGLFPGREPFWAGYGNKAWDILAYKVRHHQHARFSILFLQHRIIDIDWNDQDICNNLHLCFLPLVWFLAFCRQLGLTLTGSSMCFRIARSHQIYALILYLLLLPAYWNLQGAGSPGLLKSCIWFLARLSQKALVFLATTLRW